MTLHLKTEVIKSSLLHTWLSLNILGKTLYTYNLTLSHFWLKRSTTFNYTTTLKATRRLLIVFRGLQLGGKGGG